METLNRMLGNIRNKNRNCGIAWRLDIKGFMEYIRLSSFTVVLLSERIQFITDILSKPDRLDPCSNGCGILLDVN